MSRKHPLNYPAPQQTTFRTGRVEHKSLFDHIFGSQLVQKIEKISGHGLVPIFLGALIVFEGRSKMFVRSAALFVCVLWICLDIGLWLYKQRLRAPTKMLIISVCFTVLSYGQMKVMYYFLDGTLEDQRNDTFQH
jgi:hypothetical protein